MSIYSFDLRSVPLPFRSFALLRVVLGTRRSYRWTALPRPPLVDFAVARARTYPTLEWTRPHPSLQPQLSQPLLLPLLIVLLRIALGPCRYSIWTGSSRYGRVLLFILLLFFVGVLLFSLLRVAFGTCRYSSWTSSCYCGWTLLPPSSFLPSSSSGAVACSSASPSDAVVVTCRPRSGHRG